MGQFLISEGAGETFPLARADGGAILCQPAVGGGGTGALQLIFPNIAALEAYNATSPQILKQGQLAVVQSNNSLWELSVGTEGEVDNITVASVTAPPFANAVWTRFASGAVPTYIGQPGWHVDPANVSGTASDENSGVDAAHALLTNAEIFRRWGYTWSPELIRTVVLTYHSSQSDDSDPALFAPFLNVGNQFTLIAPLPAAQFTGTLNVVTPKNRAANQLLEATFTTTTGAVANGMMLVNATRGGSIAWTIDGGPTFRLSQPLAPYAGGDATVVTEVDTWAHGDAISGFGPLTQICIARCGGDATEFAGSSAPQFLVNNIEIEDFSGEASSLEIDGPANVAIITCIVARVLSIRSTWAFTTLQNNAIPAPANSTAQVPLNLSYRAGYSGGIQCWGAGALLDNDIVMLQGVTGETVTIGTAFVDTATQVIIAGGVSAIAGPLYGGGVLNVSQLCEYNAPAATNLPLSGGILINGFGSAYSNATTAGTTTVHLVTLTTAHLDAAAGAAGFGGMAWNGGSSLTTGGVAP